MHPVHDLQRRKRRAIAILKQHGRREGVLFVDAARYPRHSGDGNGEQPQPPPLQQNVRDELGRHHHHRYYCYDNNGNSASGNIKDKASQQRRYHAHSSPQFPHLVGRWDPWASPRQGADQEDGHKQALPQPDRSPSHPLIGHLPSSLLSLAAGIDGLNVCYLCDCEHCVVLDNFSEEECLCCREMGDPVTAAQPEGCVTENPEFHLKSKHRCAPYFEQFVDQDQLHQVSRF
ncbi:hypothetical protein HPB52_005077 [Rhipicephalus sanguineus]|uniref:Uncharacterized protein n=1 Tax=Rhipicephalus sanguineus TaxID=34632 RepID=A0A9D4PF70_RHISA|nr:hypothetical protein HPB52_005077 [Rhipicephalus sanguineus]